MGGSTEAVQARKTKTTRQAASATRLWLARSPRSKRETPDPPTILQRPVEPEVVPLECDAGEPTIRSWDVFVVYSKEDLEYEYHLDTVELPVVFWDDEQRHFTVKTSSLEFHDKIIIIFDISAVPKALEEYLDDIAFDLVEMAANGCIDLERHAADVRAYCRRMEWFADVGVRMGENLRRLQNYLRYSHKAADLVHFLEARSAEIRLNMLRVSDDSRQLLDFNYLKRMPTAPGEYLKVSESDEGELARLLPADFLLDTIRNDERTLRQHIERTSSYFEEIVTTASATLDGVKSKQQEGLNILVYWLTVLTMGAGALTFIDKYQSADTFGRPADVALWTTLGVVGVMFGLFILAGLRQGVFFPSLFERVRDFLGIRLLDLALNSERARHFFRRQPRLVSYWLDFMTLRLIECGIRPLRVASELLDDLAINLREADTDERPRSGAPYEKRFAKLEHDSLSQLACYYRLFHMERSEDSMCSPSSVRKAFHSLRQQLTTSTARDYLLSQMPIRSFFHRRVPLPPRVEVAIWLFVTGLSKHDMEDVTLFQFLPSQVDVSTYATQLARFLAEHIYNDVVDTELAFTIEDRLFHSLHAVAEQIHGWLEFTAEESEDLHTVVEHDDDCFNRLIGELTRFHALEDLSFDRLLLDARTKDAASPE